MAVRRRLRCGVSFSAVFCFIVGSLVLLGASQSGATSTTYYVDNTAACPGLGTQTNPWCDFSVVNTKIFGPGDQILLKSGDTFTSGMFLEGSGTSTNYVTVGSYGAGSSPIINGNESTSFVGVQLYNESYVEVENLNIENAETAILINDPNSQTGYRFLNLHLSGNAEGRAISMTSDNKWILVAGDTDSRDDSLTSSFRRSDGETIRTFLVAVQPCTKHMLSSRAVSPANNSTGTEISRGPALDAFASTLSGDLANLRAAVEDVGVGRMSFQITPACAPEIR